MLNYTDAKCSHLSIVQLGIRWKVEPSQVILGIPHQNQQDEAGLKVASKHTESWESRFEQLKKFHTQTGHFRVPYKINPKGNKKRPHSEANDPDEETLKLGGWVKRQRSQYTSDALSADRIEKLQSIGFKFKPGRQSKDERTELQLGLLDALRNRRELNIAQVADLNYLYDHWKRRAETGSTAPAFGNAGRAPLTYNKHDNKWTENFEKLKEFKLRNGHMRIPRGDDKELKALAKWVGEINVSIC